MMTPPGLQDTDAASLDRLHDIVLPESVSWWPPAPGWYAVFALALLAFAVLAWRAWRSWQRNAYRRAALAELEKLGAKSTDGLLLLPLLPALLKRTALAAYPRTQVASLSGEAWLEFLDQQAEGNHFTTGPGKLLSELSFRPGAAAKLEEAEAQELLALARDWIEHHHPAAGEDPSC